MYYLPNLGDGNHGAVFLLGLGGFLDDSQFGVTYIYPIPSAEVKCSGTVSALEYCYTRTSDSSTQLVFTLLILMQNNHEFTITDKIDVRSTPGSSICTFNHCDIAVLNMSNQFPLPRSNFTFGLFLPVSGLKLLAYDPGSFPQFQASQYQANFVGRLDIGEVHPLSASNMVTGHTLRLFQMHLSKLSIIIYLAIIQVLTLSTIQCE